MLLLKDSFRLYFYFENICHSVIPIHLFLESKRFSKSYSIRPRKHVDLLKFQLTSTMLTLEVTTICLPYLCKNSLGQLRLHHNVPCLRARQEAGSCSVPRVEELSVLQFRLMRHGPFDGLWRADRVLAVLRIHGSHSVYTWRPGSCA